MPYKSTSDLPAQFKKYSANGQKAALQAFNNAYDSDKGESHAFAIAHSAAKRADGKGARRVKAKKSP
jgi:cation transport regulator ChaB